MSPATLKTFTSVHTWTGLAAGMALFICFYTGAITVFVHELEGWDGYTPAPHAEQTYEQAQRLIDQVLAADPGAAPALRLYPSNADHPGNVALWYERLPDGSYTTHRYRLNGDDSLDTTPNTALLADFIYRLHYTAGLPSSFGLYVLGVVCLIYGLALVTGLIVFLPNFLRDLFVIRAGRNKKRFWLDTHNVVGVISLPWHFMFAWSSALLAIGIYFLAPFQFLVFDDDLLELLGPDLGTVTTLEPTGGTAPMLPVVEIVAIAEREAPGIDPVQIRYTNAGDSNATVTVYGEVDAGTLASHANVTLAAASGEVLNVNHPQSASAGATFYNGLIALHFASFGGFTARWVYFFLGLAGAFLFYSGNLLWVETRRKRRQPEQPSTGRLLARLNSGVCIGCMAGVSAAFLASRGLAALPERAELTELAYYAVFLASVAWCFLRSVADGARDLLYLSTVLSAAIPVFDWLFIGMPVWRSVTTGHWSLVTVDALAILGAVAFWRMGLAVHRRGREGDPNSVWAQPRANADPAQPASRQPRVSPAR